MIIHKIPLFTKEIIIFENIDLNHNKILSEIEKIEYLPIKHKATDLSHLMPPSGTHISRSNNILNEIESGEIINNKFCEAVKTTINIFEYDIDFKIVSHWATKTEPSYMGEFHTHKNFWLTGCYYPHGELKEQLSVAFKKESNHLFTPNIKKANTMNADVYELFVKKGTLIIFEADLQHKIGFNNTNKNRYSIAFNILPKGLVGETDSRYVF